MRITKNENGKWVIVWGKKKEKITPPTRAPEPDLKKLNLKKEYLQSQTSIMLGWRTTQYRIADTLEKIADKLDKLDK